MQESSVDAPLELTSFPGRQTAHSPGSWARASSWPKMCRTTEEVLRLSLPLLSNAIRLLRTELQTVAAGTHEACREAQLGLAGFTFT